MIKNIIVMPWEEYRALYELMLCLQRGSDNAFAIKIANEALELLEEKER